jgi:hypothetical protein
VTPLSAICLLRAGRKASAILMNQQRFDRVTGAWTLGFRIHDDLQRRFNLGAVVYNDMTHADTAGDHRDRRLLTTQLVQAAPPRGISMSMYLSMRSISFTSARSGLSIA